MNFKSKLLTDPRLRSYRKPKSKDYMQITLTLLLIIVFLAFAIVPSVSTAFKLNKRVAEYKIVDKQLTDKIIAMRQVRENYKEISPYIHLIDQAAPKNPNEGVLLYDLNHISAETGTIIKQTGFFEKHGKPVNTLNVNLTVIGTYDSTKEFLNKLNKLLRIVRVDNIDLSLNNTYIKNRVGATIVAEAYYY